MAEEDQTREPLYSQNDPAVGGLDEVEISSGGLVSRQQALKLAGAVTLGGAFGLLGSQQTAHARRRKKRRRPPAPAPAPKLAASNPGQEQNYGTIATGLPGDYRLAQTFKTPITGRLVFVEVVLRKPGNPGNADSLTGDYLFQITKVNSQIPSNTVLATAAVADDLVPNDVPRKVRANFVTPLNVFAEPNTQYALVVSRPGATVNNALQVSYSGGNGYADGIMSYSTSPTGSFSTVSLDYDMVFWTYVL